MKRESDGPIVEGVRKVRAEIAREFNYDLRKYMEYLRQVEAQARKEGRPVAAPRRRAERRKGAV